MQISNYEKEFPLMMFLPVELTLRRKYTSIPKILNGQKTFNKYTEIFLAY